MTPGEQATKAVAEYLDDILDEKAIRMTAEKFKNDLCEKKDEWTGIQWQGKSSRPKLDVAKAIREFIAGNLQECTNTTLEQFIVKAYSGKKDAPVFVTDPGTGRDVCSDETKSAAEQVFRRLDQNANALASTRGLALSDCYSNIYLTVPGNCNWFYQAISKVAGANGGITVYQSSAEDRIVLCKLYTGVPAWAFYWTPGAEEMYEGNNGDGVTEVGLHMDQGAGGADWSAFPNLYPEKLWSEMQRKGRIREAKISKTIREELTKAEELSMLAKNEKDEKYYDIILLDQKRTAEELLARAELDDKKKYVFHEVLNILVEKGELLRFKIEFINQVMTTADDLTQEQLDEFHFELAARTIRRYVEKCNLLAKTIPVIEKLKELNDRRTPVNPDVLTIYINCLIWDLLLYDDRRHIWKLNIGDEKPIGAYLEDKFQQTCAHYYGFQAFSALDAEEIQDIRSTIEELRNTASDEELAKLELVSLGYRQALKALRNAKKKTVNPWSNDSPFRCANESAWPMATQDFVERAGSEEIAKAIRGFYTELIDNM